VYVADTGCIDEERHELAYEFLYNAVVRIVSFHEVDVCIGMKIV
jgi:hypothetical protein